jgi:hypothetical protein
MTMTQHLSKATAEHCLNLVTIWLAAHGAEEAPKLYEPDFHCGGWAIALEGGPIAWTLDLTDSDGVTWPKGVFAEPVNHWCLGLYPA